MASAEEIMLTFMGKDEVSNVAKNINGNVQSMASSLTSRLNSANAGFLNLSSAANGMLGGLTGGKSASDLIFGTSSKAETNKVLLKNMTETQAGAEQLYKTVDSVTDNSLTSMQELIPAMNAFKAATGASDSEMNNITEGMANFGAAVLAQTGSTELAQTAMMDLSKGIKGAFESLDQFGVSEDALMRTGLWSGKEDDVEGYMAAVTKVIGSTDELMETNEGLDAQMGKAFSRAGKKIGNEFLPIIKDVKKSILGLDNATGGNLFAGVLVAAQGLESINQVMFHISTTAQGLKDIKEALGFVKDIREGKEELKDMSDAAEDATDAVKNLGEVQYAPGSTDVLDATTINEASSHAGGIELTDVDMDELIKDKKKNNYDDFLKYLEEDNKNLEKVEKALQNNKIDNETFESLTKHMKEDKTSLIEAFAETGDIPDLNVRKQKQKDLVDFAEGMIEEQSSIDRAVSSLGKGEINADDAKLAIQQSKQNRENLIEGLSELGDIPDIDVDTKKSSKSVKAIDNVVDSVDDVGDASKKLKKAEAGMEGLEAVATMVPAGVGAEAAAAGAEAEVAAGGFAGLGASITAMLVPLLTVAAVVAIMIPIVVGLAAEALIFVRALAEVIKALNFDSIDLSSSIDGLKQIGQAMWELFATMGSMTLLAGATILYEVASVFLGFQDPVRVAVDAIKDAVKTVNELGSVGNIDESIPSKMQALGDTLKSVSEAFKSMQSVVGDVIWGGVMTLGGALGSFTDNIRIAKTELTNAFNELNNFNIGTINTDVANNLKTVSETLKAVSEAFGALCDINWDVNTGNISNLGGAFGSISDHLIEAKQDIIQAANTINQFTNLPTIDEGITTSLQNVSKGVTSVADTLKALRGISDSQKDWLGQKIDLGDAISTAKEDIETAANELKNLEGIADVPDVHDKLNNVGKAAATMTNTLKALKGVSSADSGEITTNIQEGRYAISNAAIHLSSLSGIPTVSNIGEKLNNVGKAAATMTNTLKALIGVPQVDAGSINYKVQQGRYAISNAAIHLASLSGIPIVPDVSEKLNNVGRAAATTTNTLSALNSMPVVDAASINLKVQQVRYAISNAATQLGSLAGIATIPEGIGELLNRVGSAANQVKNIAINLSTFPQVNPAVSQSIATAVGVIKNIITQLNSLAGSSVANVGGLLSSITNAVTQMKATLQAASTGFYASGVSIGQSIVNGIRGGLAGLNGVVSSAMSGVTSIMVSIGSSGGSQAGTATTNAFKGSLNLADAMTAEMGYVKQAVDSGISAAVTAAQSGAEKVVEAFKAGINSGSPGDIAWTMHDEMWYTVDFIKSEGRYVVATAKKLGQDIVEGFGNPQLSTGFSTNFNASSVDAMSKMNSRTLQGNPNNPVQINIGEGAIQLDARNLTTKESKQVMINALEGLDCINNVNIRGM